MKKIVFAGFLAAASVLLAADYSITVPAGSAAMIAPPRTAWQAPTWVTNQAVTVGSLRIYDKTQFMAITAGTTGTTPPSTATAISSDGAVSWLAVPKGKRQSLSIVTENDGAVWYQDSASTTNGGVYAYLKGQQYSDNTDAAVWVYTADEVKFNVKDR